MANPEHQKGRSDDTPHITSKREWNEDSLRGVAEIVRDESKALGLEVVLGCQQLPPRLVLAVFGYDYMHFAVCYVLACT